MTTAIRGPIDPAAHLVRLRERAPLIHNITNLVAMNPMANVLLALGASPAMVHAREEAAEFAALADALTINIGTLSPHWLAAMEEAAEAAQLAGKPWVFDPVAVGATAYRREAGQRLLEHRPTVIRGNASEILALERQGSGGRGVDSSDPIEAAEQAAITLARRTAAVVAVTGEVDLVTDGRHLARVPGGHPLMPRVTTLGCALTGVVAAFLAGAEDPFAASVAALACYGEAGRRAGEVASGPGSFSVAFLDALYALDHDQLVTLPTLEVSDAP
ncbi:MULTISPECIES: hydroxyethylthiazole kinase [unclassified Halomonas]|uniref:hydroxyethylthiazole kinase n=1 Tax=unclassified Halomonas TaxID=2609666 RepID=UPI0028878FC8|nr:MULTISPECIES: hydroxyethylthiazole kinase [unclassified Halomonas]MDT0500024.1 hydroxyethylthiazole kinase [Halomonas sp. PAR7]MDT0512428.1 hydroxyethylthiazole kinase [Halomonas sp. LES1]MDT0591062.1 hydroxyethylthiazole kinase [Halomonas sp. PAR8]